MLNSPNLPPIQEVSQYSRLVETLPGWRRIGEILVDLSLVTEVQVQTALTDQARPPSPAGASAGLLDILLTRGDLTPQQAMHALTHQIMHYFLPFLGHALADSQRAREELADTYRRSLQSLAAQAETIHAQEERILELRREIATLKQESRSGRGKRSVTRPTR